MPLSAVHGSHGWVEKSPRSCRPNVQNFLKKEFSTFEPIQMLSQVALGAPVRHGLTVAA